MNWYDGIVIDRLWVGHSRFWIIPGTAIVAGIIVLLF